MSKLLWLYWDDSIEIVEVFVHMKMCIPDPKLLADISAFVGCGFIFQSFQESKKVGLVPTLTPTSLRDISPNLAYLEFLLV